MQTTQKISADLYHHPPHPNLINEGGEMGERIRNYDWSSTSLGHLKTWPHYLINILNLLLNSAQPIFVTIGEKQVFIYNDAYIKLLSLSKHPGALGHSFPTVWPEIYLDCKSSMDTVVMQKKATIKNNMQVLIQREEYIEEAYYSIYFNPILDEIGKISGVYCNLVKTTKIIFSQQRLLFLNKLTCGLLHVVNSIENSCNLICKEIEEHIHDFPFALLYLFDDEKNIALKFNVGLQNDLNISPTKFNIESDKNVFWPFSKIVESKNAEIFQITFSRMLPLVFAKYLIREAYVAPLINGSHNKCMGIMIAGINPCRKLDNNYLTLLKQLIDTITIAIVNCELRANEIKTNKRLIAQDESKNDLDEKKCNEATHFARENSYVSTAILLKFHATMDSHSHDNLPKVGSNKLNNKDDKKSEFNNDSLLDSIPGIRKRKPS